ncbi:Phage-related baseplate assembly protein [Enhygromyxa salina]|uniref:Phage-related baseplate assembly protein n=1 Tax=Enhygromyxa salina TaxID=215803 RepID=A0A2S9XEJ6_9BACT|nr:type VI secretion system tip protein TssI/VgrG [Enhygromyxa salina]PRP91283.1 Phage-related baseplate assembly protein [Enhygromyxa salina]
MLKLSLPPAAYELTLSDEGAPWTVTRVFIAESLNRTYRVVIDAETETEVETDRLLGCDAALRLVRGGQEQRAIGGVVCRVEYTGVVDHHMTARFEVVPAFELLRQRVKSHIWQEVSVQTIVGEVLDEGLGGYGRAVDFGSVTRGSDPRDYCTQYRESDFDYVCRLLEEEGISYEFMHDGETGIETLTFRDANDQYQELENLDGTPEVPIIGTQPELADVESIQAFEWANQLTTTGTLRRDYDWMTPRNLLSEPAVGTDARGRERRVYTHGRRRYISDDLGDRALDLRHASTIAGRVARGRSNCMSMRPGLRFKLANSERADLEIEYLITSVTHSGGHNYNAQDDGGAEALYANEFECVPYDAVVHPEPSTPKPRVHGPQTAIVTGPEGEEIHTDEHARIQVQFYWEEQPSYTAKSSCWVRVSQSWAGLGWGTQFIPRIGMEVMVEFLEGNPDRPLCTGCVYNGEYPPPFAVPDNKTQTGWRTNSSPGGGGFNELRFEDQKGEEHIYIHGEKDWLVEILNDHRETIGHDQYQEIGNDQTNVIKHDQTETVGNDRTESIGNNVEESVGKLRTVTSGDNMSFTSDKETLIEAADKITLKCGAASMTMKSNGNIVLKGNNLTLKGSGNIVLKGNKIGSN